MDYRSLGTTGSRSRASSSAAATSAASARRPEFFGQGESDEEAFAIMDAAFDLGINVFDTADAYGGGRSETAIGAGSPKRGSAVRDQVLLSTKAFNPVGEGPNDRGLSRRRCSRRSTQPARAWAPSGSTSSCATSPTRRRRWRRRSARSTTCARGQVALHRREQHRGLATGARALDRRRARPRALRVGAVATACSTARPRPRFCRSAPIRPRLLAVLAALGRLADRQVPPRPGAAGGLAHDAALGALRAPPARRGVRRPRGPRGHGRRARRQHGRRWRWPGCSHPLVEPIVVGPRRAEQLAAGARRARAVARQRGARRDLPPSSRASLGSCLDERPRTQRGRRARACSRCPTASRRWSGAPGARRRRAVPAPARGRAAARVAAA